MDQPKGSENDGELNPAEGEDDDVPEAKRSRTEEARDEQPEEEVEVDGEEARAVQAPPIPETPSIAEVRAHRLTHRPFRSWCPHCIRGKSMAAQHRRSPQKDEYQGVPKLASDYFS